AFLDWAEGIERAGANLWNPAAVVRWNADKRYLGELARAGVPVVPTAWLLRGEEADLAAVLEARGWDRVVVKPSVSATAYRTWVTDPARVRSDPSHVDRLREILRDTDAMVQPYVPEVVSEGEWSFIFLADGAGGPALSHAVPKRPAAGDFRVQDEHGGSASLAIPPVRLKERVTGIASSLWCLLPAQPLYARVDGVAVRPETHPGGFLLMELELIEPMLFLGAEPAAGARLADAVAGRLRDHG